MRVVKKLSRCGAGGVQHGPAVARVEQSSSQSGECRRNAGDLLARNLGMHALFGEGLLVCNISLHDVYCKELLVCHVSSGTH